MLKLDFGIENAKEVSASLALLEDLPAYLNPLMREWAGKTTMTHLWGMKNYPAQRAGSDYQRTGEFGSSWSYQEVAMGQFSFESGHEAAGFIVGEAQAWMHRGRWWLASERIEEQLVELAVLLDAALRKWPGR